MEEEEVVLGPVLYLQYDLPLVALIQHPEPERHYSTMTPVSGLISPPPQELSMMGGLRTWGAGMAAMRWGRQFLQSPASEPGRAA
jgi:hypothetical protein